MGIVIFFYSFVVIIIAWGGVYLFKLQQHKSRLLNAINCRQSIRSLTLAESQLLQLYLDDIKKIRRYKNKSSLVDDRISTIKGQYKFVSLFSKQSDYFYCFIGEVKCILAANLSPYLSENNVLQVVFTQGYALAVELNGHHCIAAKAIDEAIVAHQQCWFEGQHGAVAMLSENDIQHILSLDDALQLSTLQQLIQSKPACCEIITQREQTKFERARDCQKNSGFISIVCLGVALLMLSNETSNQTLLGALLLPSILFIAAMVFYFLKPKPQLARINCIKDKIQSDHVGYGSVVTNSHLRIDYPSYWQAFLPLEQFEYVDMDVTVGELYYDDYSDGEYEGKEVNIGNIELLRYGNILSVHDEIKLYGLPKFWGRNCLLLLGGVIISFLLFSSTLKYDINFSYQFLTKQMGVLYPSISPLQVSGSLKEGDWVRFNDCQWSYKINQFINKQLANSPKSALLAIQIVRKEHNSRKLAFCPIFSSGETTTTWYGRVGKVNYDSEGIPLDLIVYTSNQYKTDKAHLLPAALIKTVSFFSMIIFALLQLLLVMIKINLNRRRLHLIEDYYHNLFYKF